MEDPGRGTPACKPRLPSSRKAPETCLTPTPPSAAPNPQTASTQPKRDNPQFGEESVSSMTVRSYRALFPQGDDKIFFAIKIPLKLGPGKMQRRKPFKPGEILFSAITICAFQQKQFLLPAPWWLQGTAPAWVLLLHPQRAQGLPWPSETSPWLVLDPLPALSSWTPHTFQPSLWAHTYHVTPCEPSFPNPVVLLLRRKSIFVLTLVLCTVPCRCPSPSHRDISVL